MDLPIYPHTYTVGDEDPPIMFVLRDGMSVSDFTVTLNVSRPDDTTLVISGSDLGGSKGEFQFLSGDLQVGLGQVAEVNIVTIATGNSQTSEPFFLDVRGAGKPILRRVVNPTTVRLDGGITIFPDDASITKLSLGLPLSIGEANTMANAGTGGGESIVAIPAKIGSVIQAKGLRAGTDISIVDDVANDELVISASGSGHINWTEDEFTPTAGQVTFIISSVPQDAASVGFYVNGVLADDITDYTVSGTTVTWLNTTHALTTTDKVIIRYQ